MSPRKRAEDVAFDEVMSEITAPVGDVAVEVEQDIPAESVTIEETTALADEEAPSEELVEPAEPASVGGEDAPSEEDASGLVSVRYDGQADFFQIKGHSFRPGDAIEMSKSDAEELLTYPFERFRKVEE